MCSRVLTIVPIKELYFVMKRLYLIVDDHLDIYVLFTRQVRDWNSDVTHEVGCLGVKVNACIVGWILLAKVPKEKGTEIAVVKNRFFRLLTCNFRSSFFQIHASL